jgi:membrane-bound lytic murein transglycosylase D
MIVKMSCIALLLTVSTESVKANPFFAGSDTSRTNFTTEPYLVVNKANVVFPALLNGHQSNTINYIEKFATLRRAYLLRTFQRGKGFFPKAVAIFKKYDVPQEFRVLLALESAFNANAVSSAGAVGYWQIMDAVAREYGMKIGNKMKKAAVTAKAKKNAKTAKAKKTKETPVADDRRNFNKSTHVAARYLRDRARNLNSDLLLMAASYNCGVGNVWNAMEKCGKKSPTFWDIKHLLPAETQSYVMNFITLNVIFHNYEAFAANKLCFKDEIKKLSDIEPEICEEELCEEGSETAFQRSNDY